MDIQSLFPVYLPKSRAQEVTAEDYDTDVAANENALNQNFSILFSAVRDILDRLDTYNGG